MRIQTDQLNEGSLVFTFEAPADHFPVLREMARSGECEFTRPIGTRLKAARIREMVEIEGVVQTELRLVCGRCLAPFTWALASEFALTYTGDLPSMAETAQPEEKELDASQAGLIYFKGEEIDLTEGIQEQVILSFPLRPLCREDCKGLCVRCGADLNQGACGCPPPRAQSPFAALGRLKLGRS